MIARKPAARQASAPTRTTGGARLAAPPIVHQVLRSPGRPLDSATRAAMERRFGHDFGQVRIHADERAAESARTVNAKAYAVANNIVFNSGQYQPRSAAGLGLLAHELAHAVQQTAGRAAAIPERIAMGAAGDSAEREAEQAGRGGGWSRAAVSVQDQPCLRRQPAGTDPDAEKRLQELERGASDLRARTRQLRDRVRRTAVDIGLQTGDPSSDVQGLVTRLFPGKAHRIAGYSFDPDLSGLRTDLASTPILHFGPAFLKLPLHDQETALGGELAKVDQWSVNNGRIEAADLSDPDITERIRGLAGAKLAELHDKVRDPAVKTYVGSLRTMSTPLQFGLSREGEGDARAAIGNVIVIVRPDVTGDRGTPRGEAQTRPDINYPDLRPFIRHDGATITGIDPFPPVTVTIQTRYGPETSPDSPSDYGRGTTSRDIAIGARSLRFHEGSHGLDILKFFRDNPFPAPAIHVGMSEREGRTAVDRWVQDRRAYMQRLMHFSDQQTHCVGVTIDEFHHEQRIENRVCGGGHR
jgi:Domain of unknown function (DUF4157)